jgi:ABC-type Fe3+ transport system substrate-binding protein
LILCFTTKTMMSAEAKAFFLFVVSPDGQEIIANTGFFPLGRVAETEQHNPVVDGK